MSDFNKTIELLLEVGDMDAPAPPAPAMEPAAGMPTDAAQLPPEEPKQLTTEGKRFLIEISLKALAFDPAHIADQDRGIFMDEVTSENAESILEKIEAIVGQDIEPAETY